MTASGARPEPRAVAEDAARRLDCCSTATAMPGGTNPLCITRAAPTVGRVPGPPWAEGALQIAPPRSLSLSTLDSRTPLSMLWGIPEVLVGMPVLSVPVPQPAPWVWGTAAPLPSSNRRGSATGP